MVQLNCLSFHLFYRKEADVLLLACKVFTDALLAEGIITHFFFIRYGEGGPHIRLRLFCREANEKQLLGRISCWAVEHDGLLHMEECPFVPEVERYGGSACVMPAVQIFAASSQMVLNWLQQVYPVKTARRIGQAFKLHFLFLRAMGCTNAVIRTVLKSFLADWLPTACRALGLEAKEGNRLLLLFQEQRMKQQAVLKELLEQMDAQVAMRFDDHLLQHYFESSKKWAESFVVLDEAKRISVLSSFLHMTNNRLGLSNYDESFVAFLLLKTLEDAGKTG